MRILVVDDDDSMRELLRISLGSVGYSKVTVAASGMEAQHQISIAQKPFDCFMLDVQMPEMTGIDLCGKLRQMHLYKKSPVLMVTAVDTLDQIEAAFASGATDYVTKPFDVVDLLRRVDVADQIIVENKNADNFRRSLGAMSTLSVRQQHMAFKYPIKIFDVEGFVSMLALQNFLNRVPRLQSTEIGAYAFRVPEMWSIFHALSAREYFSFLADLSQMLVQSMSGMFEFACYAGGGTFLFVDAIKGIPQISEIESLVGNALANSELLVDEVGRIVGMSAHFGNVYSPSQFTERGSLQFISNAFESAHRRSRDERIGSFHIQRLASNAS